MRTNREGVRRGKLAAVVTVLAVATLALPACQTLPLTDEAAVAPPVAAAPALPLLEPVVLADHPYLAPVRETDVLARLRADFSLPVSTDAAVERERAWYARNPEYLDRVFGRAGPYLFHIVNELEARGMPAELALLPVVESAFDPFAYSHGRAAGLWQIIPGTGRRLGLTQNWWFDARRDVLESTRAALDYLEQLSSAFNGDWLLAVAGYNSGEGNVTRALARAAKEGHPADFWGITSFLPAETRTYVPRLLAIASIVADPAAHGVTLPTLPNEPQFTVVSTGSQIDMALAASLASLDTDALYALNPGVNRWATDPDGPHRLLLPVDRAAAFEAALAALGERERVQWTRHAIKQGETIGEIADHYHTTVAVLKEANGLRGTTIRAGDFLMIPHATQALTTYTQSADARAARTQDTPRVGVRKDHVVRTGESLWSISRVYGVNVRSLASWNSMAPGDTLSVGRSLVIWSSNANEASSPAASAPRASASTSAAASLASNDRIRQVTYVVRRGDSLSSIANRFRVTVSKLLEWNANAAKKYLQPGQRLIMFVNVTEQSG